MKVSFSKQLQIKMLRDNMYFSTLEYMRDIVYNGTIARYYYDWRYADTKENLSLWIKNLPLPDTCRDELKKLKVNANDAGMKKLLTFVNTNIKYKADSDVWKCGEVWQTPTTTWKLKTGDCEDGALLLYKCAKACGFTDQQVYIIAGSVDGGGHCYIKYVSESGLNYPVDWCYWYTVSVKMETIYEDRPEYFFGDREWFMFNENGGYVLK